MSGFEKMCCSAEVVFAIWSPLDREVAALASGGIVRDSDIAAFFVTVLSCAKRPFMVGTFKVSLETSASRTLSVT